MNDNRPTVLCGICGTPTPMTGTKRCDWCYELETRIQRHPERALAILETVNRAADKAGPRRFAKRPELPTGFGDEDVRSVNGQDV